MLFRVRYCMCTNVSQLCKPTTTGAQAIFKERAAVLEIDRVLQIVTVV